MKLLSPFWRDAAPRRHRIAQPAWVTGSPAEPPVEPRDPTAEADSWFDSSWLLRSGVEVTEHDTLDPVANDLPLGWWLDGPGALPRGLAPLSPSSPPSR